MFTSREKWMKADFEALDDKKYQAVNLSVEMSIDNSSKEESSHHQDVKVKECLCGPNKRQQMADHNYSKRDGGERGRQLKLWREG